MDLVKIVVDSIKHLDNSYILVCINNKKINRNINIEIVKASMHSSDNRLIFSRIKELLRATKVIIEFEYVKTRRLCNDNVN